VSETTDVRFWDVRRNKSSRSASYEVRWVVSGRQFSRTRATRALADSFLSELRQAARRGEAFDTDEGLPGSMRRAKRARSWFAFVLAYVDVKWPRAAAKTRDSMTDALATVTAALVDDRPGQPEALLMRHALRQYALVPASRALPRPPEIAATLGWLERASLPVSELEKPPCIRAALDALTLRLDGKAAAATTIRRKRSVFYNVLDYATELEELSANPLGRVNWKPPKVAEVVDRRVVVNPVQARELLTAVTYVGRPWRGRHLRAFFACMYFAALRPGEVKALRKSGCYLPARGWGRLTLSRSRPQANKRWTDSGEAFDDRGLKHRADDDTRSVPIPPELVTILREHIEEFGIAADRRLFRTVTGGMIYDHTASWAAARTLALTPHQVASPMAARPYDLRHAAVSLWLNGGVAVTEVANRAGHSVDVLLRVYAKCIDGGEEIANRRIDEALAA
jgi:integrase